MRREDAQTLAVFMFEAGWPPSAIDRRLRLPEGTARDAVVGWWALMGERGSW